MKAPDKIYVCIPQRLNLSTFKEDSKYVGMAYNDKGNLRSPQIEEYIHKDALVEWASNRLGRVSDMGFDDGDVEHGYIRALQDLIDKINSL